MKIQARSRTGARRAAGALAALCAATLTLVAQEPTQKPGDAPKPPESNPGEPNPAEAPPLPPHLPPMPGGASDGLQAELVKLFGKVEKRLQAIDKQLFEAGSGRVPAKPIAGSGIEELLREGGEAKLPQNVGELMQSIAQDSQRAQSDIQRILEIARQLDQQQQGSSGGGKGAQGDGGKSQGQSQSRPGGSDSRPQGREATPDAPGSKPENPTPGNDGEPKSGKQDDATKRPENRSGNNPPESQRGPGSSADGADRWGDLPVRAREIFRVEGASDLPPQYRDWIDGYYRRLQSLERR